jgi:hypothetical protein
MCNVLSPHDNLSHISVVHGTSAPAKGKIMLLLKTRCMAGRGSVATSMWGAVLPGKRSGISDLSKASIVSIGSEYLMGMIVDRRVDLGKIVQILVHLLYIIYFVF